MHRRSDVEVRTADGRTEAGERLVGAHRTRRRLPAARRRLRVPGRKASPRPDAPQTAESTLRAALRVLRQDGCEIVYAYAGRFGAHCRRSFG